MAACHRHSRRDNAAVVMAAGSLVETTSYDEWLESDAAGAGVCVIPEIIARHTHPELQFVPLEGAPPVVVHLTMTPHLPRTFRLDFIRAASPE